MSKQGTLVAIIGPTAVGKTDLSVWLARQLSASIISADSRQMYREMLIGTAAPSKEEMQGVEHHFVQNLSLEDYYSAARFQDEALALTTRLLKDDSYVILSGGSMMYVDALLKGIDDIPTVEEDVRKDMIDLYKEVGLEGIQERLKLLDPEYYEIVDLRNHKRIIHALEICYQTGKTFTSFRRNKQVERPFNIIKVGLRREREELFERISQRTELMIRNGLLEEARKLYPRRELNSLNTVGYKELFRYFDGEISLEQAILDIKRNTRVYAKKQMTWYKKDESIRWFHPSQKEAILDYVRNGI